MCYKEGLKVFLDVRECSVNNVSLTIFMLKVVQAIADKNKKSKYRAKAAEYLDRSEKVQEIVDKEKALGKYHEHYR